MSMTNMNLRIDSALRSQATEVLASYGLSPTQAIKLFLKQVVNTRKVPLSFDYQSQEPNTETLQAMTELERGEGINYESLDDFIKAHQ